MIGASRHQEDERAPVRDRWVDRAGDDGGPEARAGALFASARRGQPIDANRLIAVRGRLRGGWRRRPRSRRAWRVAAALGLVISGGALTAAANRYLHLPILGGYAPPPDTAPPQRRAPARSVVAGDPAVPPAPPVPAIDTLALLDDPPLGPQPAAEHRRPPSARAPLAPPPADVTDPAASALARESSVLGEALTDLRQRGDAASALAALDRHDVQFGGSGALAPEASLARIEALTKLRRNADALSLLDRMAPAPIGAGRGLLIARAELRASAGRRASAVADFDALLRTDPPFDAITERALWGRAACRRGGADDEQARVDLQDYLARFPSGRFARAARAALGE